MAWRGQWARFKSSFATSWVTLQESLTLSKCPFASLQNGGHLPASRWGGFPVRGEAPGPVLRTQRDRAKAQILRRAVPQRRGCVMVASPLRRSRLNLTISHAPPAWLRRGLTVWGQTVPESGLRCSSSAPGMGSSPTPWPFPTRCPSLPSQRGAVGCG